MARRPPTSRLAAEARQARKEEADVPAIGVHHTPTSDRPWDGPAATAAAPNEASVLRYMHAWYAGENPDVKGSYKFPHHGPRAGSAAVLPGVRNGLARLGGASIPSGDVDGVRAHLQAHLSDA